LRNKREKIMKRSIHCTVRDRSAASSIVDSLKQAGFRNNDVSVLMSDEEGTRDFADTEDTKAPEGAAAGAGTGAVLGGALGWLTGAGALAIPGVGALIAAGPILATLTGAALGGTVGGLTGALIGMGIPEDEAERYEGHVKSGRALVSVHTDSDAQAERAREIFAASGAEHISAAGEAVGTRHNVM
jgi:hypothetical protein